MLVTEDCTIAPPIRPVSAVRPAGPGPIPRWRSRGLGLALLVLAMLLGLAGCSIRKFAVGQVANSLTSGPDVFASDDDPELVGAAIPFGLKMMESLLQTVPKHEGLLLSCCRGKLPFGRMVIRADTPQRASRNPAAPPAAANARLSVRNCRIRRRRLAPTASRTATRPGRLSTACDPG